MMTDKIYVGIDGKRVELKGKELEAFVEQREKDQAESAAEASRIEAKTAKKEADRASAIAKLSKLGLTDDEIASLIP